MNKTSADACLKELQREVSPFYLVDHDGDKYSLIVCINHLDYEFGQPAFDAYALSRGEDPRDDCGYVTYGSGYDWEDAFREAFKDDPNIRQLTYDSESCMFTCDGYDPEVLGDFGKRFRALCLDTEKFTPIIAEGIKNGNQRRREEQRLHSLVRGRITENPDAEIWVKFGDEVFKVAPGQGQKLLDGSSVLISSENGGLTLTVDEFLDLEVTSSQYDLFDDNRLKLLTDWEQEETLSPKIDM